MRNQTGQRADNRSRYLTVGVGMAIGAGMCLVGIASTFFMLLIQFLLHKKFRFIKSLVVEQVTIRLSGGDAAFSV